MTSRKVIAILAIALLMLCPVITVCGNNAEAADSDKSVLVSVDDINESQTYSLFLFKDDAFKMVRDAFFVKEYTHNPNYDWKGHIYHFYIDTGARSTVEGDTVMDERVVDLSVEFSVKLTMLKKTNIAVMDVPSYLSGSGIRELKDIVGGTYDIGQEITLSGSMQQKMVFELGGDHYHNNELGYLNKSASVHLISEISYDVTFAVRDGKTLNLKHGTTTNLYQNDVTDYGKTYKDVKTGDAGKVIPVDNVEIRKNECALDVTVDGTKQPTRIDVEEFNDSILSKAYESQLFLKEARDTTAFFLPTLNTEIAPGSISLINTAKASTLDKVKEITEGLGGKYSTQVTDFIDVSKSIKKEIGLMHGVTYNNNGGTGIIPSEEVEEYTSFQVASNDGMTRKGYSFGGWNDGKKTYFPGETYTIGNKDVTLKAVWNKIQKDMDVITDGSGRAELIISKDDIVETLTVSNEDINVFFDKASVDIIKKSDKPLFVTILKTNDDTFYIGTKLGSEEFDGKITVILPYDKGEPCVYQVSGTTETELECVVDKVAGTISFETSGSSAYVVKYTEKPEPVPPKPAEPSNDNTILIVCICIVAVIVLAILALAWYSRKE